MKNIILFSSLLIFIWSCEQATQTEVAKTIETPEITTGFDSAFAAKVGADDYGMRKYVMAFLKRGPNRDQDSLTAANLQKAHLENIGRLAAEGKLSLAGPFLDDGELRGIYIFNVKTIEEAKALTETDPAIQQGRLVMELHPWYGSAALMEVNEWHGKLEKTPIK